MNSYEEKKQVKGFKNVFKYLAYFNKYKLLSLGYWLLLIISAGSSFLTPFALGNLVEKITIGDTHNALLWAVLFCLFETLTRGLLLARVPFFKILQNRVKRQVKLDTLHEGLNINLLEYEKLGSGVFITRLTNDLDSLANTFRNLSEMIVDLFTKMGYIVFVFVVNVWLGLFVTGMILVRIAVYAVRLHYYSKFRPQVLKKNEQINNIISETIPGLKDIKTLGLKDGIMNRINAEQKEFIKVDTKEAYYSNFWYNLSKIVNTIGTLVFVLLFIKLVGWGQVSALIFYTVYLYENNVLSFAYKFCTMLDYLKEMEINSKRVFEVANKDVFVHDEFGTHEIKRVRGKIEFKDVCFA
ncbi:MAG: ABC transporter ATP-binding protein/permease [Clostridia bacterium]|nr:ABC transporter ATP-binding protein/permease [Clostridia bacterium]